MHERLDLLHRVVVRGRPMRAGREKPGWWNLACGVERGEVLSEASHHAEAAVAVRRRGTARLARPRHRGFDCDGALAGVIEAGGEVQQHRALGSQLEAKGPTHNQVLLNTIAHAHRATPCGQCIASSASLAWSSRA